MAMSSKKIDVLSSYVLAATVTLFVALTSGCDRREEVYPAEGSAYAQDPEYVAQLEAQVGQRNLIAKERREIIAALDVVVKHHNGDKAAAEASEEGKRLVARLHANEQQFISNRLETAKITFERRQRAVADSERIKRGEAKPIDILKKKEEVK